MNENPMIEIHSDIIRLAILKIASDNPDWFHSETWLKDLLYLTPTNLKRKETNRSGREHDRNGFEDDYFKDISRRLDA